MSETRKTGTREWAEATANCVSGCSHDCRYCYARANAVRFRKRTAEDWHREIVNLKTAETWRGYHNGNVMFPSTHDITPAILPACLRMIENIMACGNSLLIVTKPHMECVESICRKFTEARSRILFRFTIGAMDDDILRYWEPHAPTFNERLLGLQYAHAAGFATSVSMEPLLDASHVADMFALLEPYVTDTIWIGCLNRIRQRVKIETDEDRRQVDMIDAGQTPEAIRQVYESLKSTPKVRWKDSYRMALGLSE